MVYCPNPDCLQPHNPQQDPITAKFCQACGTFLIIRGEAGQYRLISVLGKGGFGRTFLAEQLVLDSLNNVRAHRCVIKQLHRVAVSDQRNFQAEANRLRKLGEHPQIPELLDALENELGQFLVQEFAPGENLQQQVEAKGPWDEVTVRSLLISLTKVLQHVHSFGIIHRDIKPENIVAPVMYEDSQGADNHKLKPMLVDFGSAKWIRQTPAKTVIGSAGYASPEQSMGQATFASDIYSLGLTCLYLLTGVHPFQLYSAAEDRWVWQDYLSKPLEPRFVQVLSQMVARSLQQRYESADQVALDLQVSQNLLLNVPQQILVQAKETVVPRLKSLGLKKLLNGERGDLFRGLALNRRSLQSKTVTTAAGRLSSAAQQRWVRVHRLAPNMGVTQAIAISSDAKFFATGGSDGAVRLWHLRFAELVHTFARRRVMGTGHRGSITALTIHPDNRALYSASEDGTIKEWDVAARQLLNTIPVTGWTPTSITVTPDGTQLISANRDGKIIAWEIASLLPIAQLAQHQRSINTVAVTSLWDYLGDPSGNLLVSASDDGTVKLWCSKQHAERSELQLARTLNLRQQTESLSQSQPNKRSLPSQDLRAVCVCLYPLSHSAYQLVVAASDGSVWLYRIDQPLMVSEPVCLHRFSQPIRTMAVSSSRCLAVGTEDRLLTLWQLDSLECVAELAHGWGVSAIAFIPNGQALITASDDETLSIWRQDA